MYMHRCKVTDLFYWQQCQLPRPVYVQLSQVTDLSTCFYVRTLPPPSLRASMLGPPPHIHAVMLGTPPVNVLLCQETPLVYVLVC